MQSTKKLSFSLTLLVLLLKCLQSLHWSARGPVHPFWHSMLQAGTGSLLETLESGGSAVPYITKYQFLRIPLFWAAPGVIKELGQFHLLCKKVLFCIISITISNFFLMVSGLVVASAVLNY